MKKNILIPLFTLLTSCTSDVNDPIVRFWNGDYSVRNNAAELNLIKKEEFFMKMNLKKQSY